MKRTFASLCLLFSAATFSAHEEVESSYHLQLFAGEDAWHVAEFVCKNIITAFREYPYLYDGNTEGQYKYYSGFIACKDSAVFILYDNKTPIGYIRGAALSSSYLHEMLSIIPEVETYYSIADLVILPEYRGRHLSYRLFDTIEKYALSLGYTRSFTVTETYDEHPLKPVHYKEFGFGYVKYVQSDVKVSCHFLTLQPDGSSQDQEHILNVWLKDLKA